MHEEEAPRRTWRKGFANTACAWGMYRAPRAAQRRSLEVLRCGVSRRALPLGALLLDRDHRGLSSRQRVRGHNGPGEREARQRQLQPADNAVQRTIHVAST